MPVLWDVWVGGIRWEEWFVYRCGDDAGRVCGYAWSAAVLRTWVEHFENRAELFFMSIEHTGTRAIVPGRRSAFSLVELLVVIAIIALLMAILLPALSGARQAGLKSGTQSMINALTNAASSFSNDHGSRMPGYFSSYEMGGQQNIESGMSAMENVMLELGGPDAILGRMDDDGVPAPNPAQGIIAIAPFVGDAVRKPVIVNINLIGSKGAYFAPDKNFIRTMDHEARQQAPQNPGNDGQELMLDVVDAFGNPLLAWVKDESSRGSIDPDVDDPDDVYRQFATLTSDGTDADDGPAWFYLASNETFFGDEAENVGDSGANQRALSALSPQDPQGAAIDGIDRIRTLTAMLASPSYYLLEAGQTLEAVAFDEIYPARARGRLIVQSAGVDGYYFSTNEKGWNQNAHTEGGEFHLDFGNNYKIGESTDRLTDDDGKFITGDLASEFDDILGTVN